MTRFWWLLALVFIVPFLLVAVLVWRASHLDEATRVITEATTTTSVDLDVLFPPPPSTTTTTTAHVHPQPRYTPRTTAPIVRGPRTWTWDQLANCESGGNWADTRNGYQGGVHFHPTTWDRYRTRWLNDPTLPEDANLATREQQIRVAEKVLELEGPGAWPVCSYQIGMR